MIEQLPELSVPEIFANQPWDCGSTPLDPKGLGQYRRHDLNTLRGDYARFREFTSRALLQKLIGQHAPNGWAATLANSVMADLRGRERPECRYDQRNRPHDMLEGAEVMSQFARSLMDARHAHTKRPFERTEELMQHARDSVDGLLSGLVHVIAERWVPGVQNIGCRLPLSRQADFEVWVNGEMNRCLHAIDQCRYEYLRSGHMEFESKRWQCGWGLFDVALWTVVGPFKETCKMAEGIIDTDDATSAVVKANAVKAWALLDAVQIEWIVSTWESLEDSIGALKKQLDVLQFAQRVRGVSDELAPLILETLRWQK